MASQTFRTGLGLSVQVRLFGQSLFKNKLYLFWKSEDTSNRIFFSASTDGQTWPLGQVINEVSSATELAPAACVYDGELYLFWRSNSSDVIVFAASSDGLAWPDLQGINQATSAVPAPCVIDGRLFLFWTDANTGAVLFTESRNGINFRAPTPIINQPKIAARGPSVCVFNGQPFVFWPFGTSTDKPFGTIALL